MERSDDDIHEFINGMWPDLGFTVVDLRKPNGERFRHLLMLFLELFYGKVSFAKINFGKFTKTPELFTHNEMAISLFREVNELLRKLSYHSFRFGDLFNPTSTAVREVLSVLLNLATFMESNTETIEEAKAMAQSLAQRQREGEKRLVEENKHLAKCKQLAEERKMHETELLALVSAKKEEVRQIQKEVHKFEEEANAAIKRQHALQQKIEQAEIIFGQAESERSKALEEVVLDPESLVCELNSLKKEKQILHDEYNSYKERLPALEQQLRDRAEKLEEDKEMMNKLIQLRAREEKVKAELNEQEVLLRKEEKEVDELEGNLYREQCTIESKKRILDENMQEMELERNLAEEEISTLRLVLGDEAKRKQHQEAQIQSMEERRRILSEQLEQKLYALEEMKCILEEIDVKFHQKIAALENKELEHLQLRDVHIQQMIDSFQSGKPTKKE